MGRSKRGVYDPTIVSRLADDQNAEGELYFSDSERSSHKLNYIEGYMNDADNERQETSEILDPKLHNLRTSSRGSMAGSASRQKRRRRCLWITGLVVTVAVIVAVICVVAIPKSAAAQKRKRTTPPRPKGAPDGIKNHATLPPPPSNLQQVCTDVAEVAANASQPLDSAALEGCRAACQPSECCDIPSQFKSSCLRGNEDVCMAYHQECFVVSLAEYGDKEVNPFVMHNTDVVVQPAPSNLKDLCSVNALISNAGVKACTKMCKPNACCYDKNVTSCSDQANCLGYSPCLNLRSHSTLDSTITKEVNALCRRNKLMQSVDNRKNCNNACKLARCCFGKDGCWTRAEGFCSQYKMCANLYGEKNDQLKDVDDGTYDDYYDDDDGGTYDGDDGTCGILENAALAWGRSELLHWLGRSSVFSCLAFSHAPFVVPERSKSGRRVLRRRYQW
jgi:hypothetical protein